LFDEDVQSRKIFVGGITPETTSSDLMGYFSKFGEIEDINIIGELKHKPRGYCFITFQNQDSVKMVLTNKKHLLNNTEVDCGLAVVPGNGNPLQGHKLYVSKIPRSINKDEILERFKEFGSIKKVLLVLRRSRNDAFAFVDFSREDGLKRALKYGTISINGSKVKVELAIPKKNSKQVEILDSKSSEEINPNSERIIRNLPQPPVEPHEQIQASFHDAFSGVLLLPAEPQTIPLLLTKKLIKRSFKIDIEHKESADKIRLNLPLTQKSRFSDSLYFNIA